MDQNCPSTGAFLSAVSLRNTFPPTYFRLSSFSCFLFVVCIFIFSYFFLFWMVGPLSASFFPQRRIALDNLKHFPSPNNGLTPIFDFHWISVIFPVDTYPTVGWPTGPPGTGKSTMVRGIARMMAVPMVYVPTSKVFSKWYGESERNLAEIFDACQGMVYL